MCRVEGDRSFEEGGYPSSGWPSEGRYTPAGHYGPEAQYPSSEPHYAPETGYPAAEGRYSPAADPGVADPRRTEPEEPTRMTVGPRSGVPIPEARPPRRPSVPPSAPAPSGEMYRSRRPATAALLGVLASALEIPVLLLLLRTGLGSPPLVSGVVAPVCLMVALPLLAMGLYAVATGAVRAAGPNSAQAWLRPPVAYLSVALVLFVAAGLAA